jgi:S-adenosylmethionine-dependent carboxyl methyltransferase
MRLVRHDPVVATTDGMKRGGYYDEHSEYQEKVAESGSGLVRACVDAVPLPGGDETFVVADYGASTGKNSIAAVGNAIDQVRTRRAGQPAVALHNDLATNDWNEFFTNLRAAPDSYRQLAGPAVIPMVSAVSFFEPAAPAGGVHVGLSFSAAHWLRDQPTVEVADGFYFCEATGAARTALAAQADTDWTAFLEARASDLASGGRLLVQMVGSEPAAEAGDEPRVTARLLLRAMAEVGAAMATDGDLDPGAVDRYVLAVYARTADEARAPLERSGSVLAGSFTVVECRTDPVANPYLDQWRADGDAQAYGKSYAAFVRGFTESSLRTNLFGPGSRGKSVDELTDEFFTRLTARFAADPERDRFEDWTLTVVLERRPR